MALVEAFLLVSLSTLQIFSGWDDGRILELSVIVFDDGESASFLKVSLKKEFDFFFAGSQKCVSKSLLSRKIAPQLLQAFRGSA